MAIMPSTATHEMATVGLAAFGVYSIYCDRRDGNPQSDTYGLAWPSRSEIAKLTGLNPSYVSTMRTKLVNEGWIEIVGYTERGNALVKLLKGADEFETVAQKRREKQSATSSVPAARPNRKSKLTILRPPRRRATASPALTTTAATNIAPEESMPPAQFIPSDNPLDNPTSFDNPTLSDATTETPCHSYSFSLAPNSVGDVGYSNMGLISQPTPLDIPNRIIMNKPNHEPKGLVNLPPTSSLASVGRSVGRSAAVKTKLFTSRHPRERWLEYAFEQHRLGLGIKFPLRYAEARHADGQDDWKLDYWLKAKAEWEARESRPSASATAPDPPPPDEWQQQQEWAAAQLATLSAEEYQRLYAEMEARCRDDARYKSLALWDDTTKREHYEGLMKRHLLEGQLC